VQWNAHKKRYDLWLALGVLVYLFGFAGATSLTNRGAHAISPPIILIRASGTCAIVLLHFILAIGPLARLDRRFAPLLYNRRHMGVTMFFLALLHGALSILFYGGFGVRNPVSAMVGGYDSFGSISGFPFEVLGFVALLILFLMAATSHDFWLKNLTPAVWKALHMGVYVAYALLVLHVALGAMQSEYSVVYPVLLLAGSVGLSALHLMAGEHAVSQDIRYKPRMDNDWIDVCAASDIPDFRARTAQLKSGERIAVFRDGDCYSAISNVCAHQGGPLGEGKVLDGCVTCPWHGYQYRAQDGQSPPPYTEKIPTYEVRIKGGRVQVHPNANAPGTRVEPARYDGHGGTDG
jgi:nitrite reductase/ring-hydroxylating ferredoxin subunit/DMSO/TMAO reductase YedYZ heme-binding membrane subunit